MFEHEDKDLGIKFSVQDPITVRHQLAWLDTVAGRADRSMGLWLGAVHLIEPDSWECEHIEDYKSIDVDIEQPFAVAGIMYHVGNVIEAHIYRLATPKKEP